MSIENNGWIPGDEPEKDGWYEVAFGEDAVIKVCISYYSAKTFHLYEEWGIIAHKPITLSEPYKPPEPERELLCPFCNEQINIYSDSTGFYFACERDLMRLPGSNTEKEAKKFLFDIYDKLNPKEGENG